MDFLCAVPIDLLTFVFAVCAGQRFGFCELPLDISHRPGRK
jgi:hypothetical protein